MAITEQQEKAIGLSALRRASHSTGDFGFRGNDVARCALDVRRRPPSISYDVLEHHDRVNERHNTATTSIVLGGGYNCQSHLRTMSAQWLRINRR
jgi:hypothetical protein